MTPDYIEQLLNVKFGKTRGRNTRAADAIGVHRSNFSSALSSGRVPQKYIDAIKALPDLKIETGVSTELNEEVNQLTHYFTTRLTPDARKHLEFLSRFATDEYYAPDFSEDEEITALWFENILSDMIEVMRHHQAALFKRVEAVVAEEKVEAKKQLNLELADLKHLVADELTENEINADVDPLA